MEQLTPEDQKLFAQIEGFPSLSLEQYKLVLQVEDYWRRLVYFVLAKYSDNLMRHQAICCLVEVKALVRIAVTIGEEIESQKDIAADVEDYWANSEDQWQHLVQIVKFNCPNNWAKNQVNFRLIEAKRLLAQISF
jgi:hypothetical protein